MFNVVLKTKRQKKSQKFVLFVFDQQNGALEESESEGKAGEELEEGEGYCERGRRGKE